MTFYDEFKYLVGGYYGIREMDEYELKVYVLKDLEKYIKEFVKLYAPKSFDYEEEFSKLENELTLKTKLQDSLLVLDKIDSPVELMLMINKRLKEMENEVE